MVSKKDDSLKVQIARLEEKLKRTLDDIERGIIDSEITNLKQQLKDQERGEVETKVNSSTTAPSILERKEYFEKHKGYNGHNPKHSVNGVFERTITTVSF